MTKIVALFNVVGYTAEQYSQVFKDMEAAGKLKDPAYIHRVVAQQTDGLLIIRCMGIRRSIKCIC